MKTLLIPCAGKSSRFPNMKPKWLLTHPDGELMIQKAVSTIDFNDVDRVVVTIVRKQTVDYDAKVILQQAFANTKLEICELEDFTSSASETIVKTVEKMNIKGMVIIKDSDNVVNFEVPTSETNAVVGVNLANNSKIRNIPGKSFLIVNEQSVLLDIVEKQIVSNIICVGVYIISNVEEFIRVYRVLENCSVGELYISHVISAMISSEKNIFQYIEGKDYEDWGTLEEWRTVQNKFRTYFVDVDGVLLKNSGKYGNLNWSNNNKVIKDNCEIVRKLQENGAQVIITTARPELYRSELETLLNANGLYPTAIVMGLNHSARVLVNDFSPTNPYPSAIAINIPRDGVLKDYLK